MKVEILKQRFQGRGNLAGLDSQSFTISESLESYKSSLLLKFAPILNNWDNHLKAIQLEFFSHPLKVKILPPPTSRPSSYSRNLSVGAMSG